MPEQRKRLRSLLKILVSGGLLGLIFHVVPLNGVIDALRAAAWDIVALSFLVIFLAHFFKSVQMYLILQHQRITLSPLQIYAVNLITMFYGLFLPGVLAGGAIRWYHFSRTDKKPAQALAAIILSRVLETSTLLCLGCAFWLIDRKASDTVSMEILLLLVLGSLVVYLVSFSRRAHALLLRLTDWRVVPGWIREKSRKVLASLGKYEDLPMSRHVAILLFAFCHHLAGLVSLYLLAVALQLNVDFATLGWIRSLVAIAMLLPVTIAGLGVREVTFIAFLIPYGVAMDDALTLSLLVFSRGLVFSLAGGVIEAKRMLFARKALAK